MLDQSNAGQGLGHDEAMARRMQSSRAATGAQQRARAAAAPGTHDQIQHVQGPAYT